MTVTEQNELAQKRAGLVGQARALLDLAAKEKRGLTADENHQYDVMVSDALALKKTLDSDAALRAEETQLQELRETVVGGKDDPSHRDSAPGEAAEYRGVKLTGADVDPQFQRRSSKQYAQAFRSYLTGEARTAAAFANDVDADGGYLHAPVQFVARLLKALDNAVFVRQFAQVVPVTSSDSIGFPQLATDFADADWTTEVGTITPDASAQLAERDFTPTQLTKEIDVSMKLLRTAALSPESIVADRLAFKFAVTEEKAYMTGDGSSNKPLGIFVTSGTGAIPTSRDVVSEVAVASKFTADTLRAARFAMLPQYRSGARWLLHSDSLKAISKFKESTTGAYLWHPSLLAGAPDVIDGFPVDESQYCPNTFTANLYVGALVNWNRGYLIADMMDLTIQRLNELLARNGKVGFIGRKYTTAGPVDALAFVRLQLASA
jgi:HK97 family phage major capsid protein